MKLDPLLLKIKSGSISQPSAAIHLTAVIVSPRSVSARSGQDKRELITFLDRPWLGWKPHSLKLYTSREGTLLRRVASLWY
jgi:hypothetical protein